MVFVIVAIAILLGGIRIVGLSPYTVLSGSMEPAYHVGSVIYVTRVDTNDLKVGDAVTYKMTSDIVVTHRIVEILEENGNKTFVLKGDANNTVDGEHVTPSAIIGKAVFTIPFLGYVSEFVRQPIGLVVIAATCIAVVILSFAAESVTKQQADDELGKTEPNGSEE